jgi:hypothetical protein
MLFREVVTVYGQNHTKHTLLIYSVDTGQNSVLLNLVVPKVTTLL